jgi:DNA-binding CsgD family transcriptional regulator
MAQRSFEGYLQEFASYMADRPRRGRELTPPMIVNLLYASHGCDERETAAARGVSYETVHGQMAEARARLAAKNAAHAVAIAFRFGLIQ